MKAEQFEEKFKILENKIIGGHKVGLFCSCFDGDQGGFHRYISLELEGGMDIYFLYNTLNSRKGSSVTVCKVSRPDPKFNGNSSREPTAEEIKILLLAGEFCHQDIVGKMKEVLGQELRKRKQSLLEELKITEEAISLTE